MSRRSRSSRHTPTSASSPSGGLAHPAPRSPGRHAGKRVPQPASHRFAIVSHSILPRALLFSNVKEHRLGFRLSRELHSCSAIAQRRARAQRAGARRSQPLGPCWQDKDLRSTAPHRSGRNKDSVPAACGDPLPSRASQVHRVRLTTRSSSDAATCFAVKHFNREPRRPAVACGGLAA